MFGSKKVRRNISQQNIQAEKSYGNGSDIKTFTGKTDIKKLDGDNLMAKFTELKSLTTLIT